MNKRILLLYHYFHPDDVVSAQHYSQLAEDLVERGWEVMAMPTNRARHNTSTTYLPREQWKGIDIRRIWRPPATQVRPALRAASALWVLGIWSFASLRRRSVPRVDAVIVGTDPAMSPVVAMFWRRARPKVKLIHWCFDLFPDTALKAGLLGKGSVLARILSWVLRRAYRDYDLIIDTGSCQRERLSRYGCASGPCCTPWALTEPPEPLQIDPREREEIFGDARLALFYSGNIGMAYSYDLFLELARRLRGEDVRIVFGVRGARLEELKRDITGDDVNIGFTGFAPMERLEARLSAADVHLVSLREAWTGTLVPSKFFGSLAVGRPVVFQGRADSAIGNWITKYKLGWVLTPETVDSVARELAEISSSPERLAEMRAHCHAVYHDVFSRKQVLDRWDHELRLLFPEADSLSKRSGETQPPGSG